MAENGPIVDKSDVQTMAWTTDLQAVLPEALTKKCMVSPVYLNGRTNKVIIPTIWITASMRLFALRTCVFSVWVIMKKVCNELIMRIFEDTYKSMHGC